jgi:hypothetical protein
MAQYPFLSAEWLEESRKIRAEFESQVPPIPVSIKMNQVINEVPFGDGVIHAHIDTSSGRFEIDTGHLEAPDLTLTLGYDTAKAILVDGDSQAAMSAFLGGRIKVDGDITKMIALQTSGAFGNAGPAAAEVWRRVRDITAP